MTTTVVVLGRCFVCGRPNVHRPEQHYVREHMGKNYDVINRPCFDERFKTPCLPLTDEDKQDPVVKEHWTKPPPLDHLDEGVRDIIRKCLEEGIATIFSCDGHKTRAGYVEFYTLEGRDRALELFKDLQPWPGQRTTRVFGTIYRMLIPKGDA